MSVFDKLAIFNYKNNTGLFNLPGSFFALVIKKLFQKQNSSILIVTSNMFEARNIYNKFLDDSVILFEDDELSFKDESLVNSALQIEKINTLNDLLTDNKKIVITDVKGYTKKLSNVDDFNKRNIIIDKTSSLTREFIIDKLAEFGYKRCSMVEKMGDYAVRGFVLDVFPINTDLPIRIEFFGDDIESIRYFELNSQQSVSNTDSVIILPFNEKEKGTATLYDYLENPIVVYKDYNQIKFTNEKEISESLDLKYDYDNYYFDFLDIKTEENLYYFDFDSNVSDVKLDNMVDFNVKSVPMFNENFDKINEYVNSFIDDGKTVVLCINTLNINNFLENLSFSYVLTNFDIILLGKVNIVKEKLSAGFIKDNYVFLTDYELFGRKNVVHKKTKFNNTSRIGDISKLEIGDYIVHNAHGIGIYNGIKSLKKGMAFGDYLEVLYVKGDKLYIPASKIELISKYNGKDGYVPSINSLNSTSWAKSKQRIREKIKIEAARLIKIQAERQLKKGFAFSKDTPLQTMFESEFMYDITDDQEKVTLEIKNDMESIVPMDRILCGDVGYGKTEVAFRAMFKACFDSKQVLYLCPTTLLCRQQYEVALERFKNYPINIGILNRFVSIKETNKTLKKLENGEIDILFATHRGLSSDVVFNDLGFLVIDEEQRFGVVQKERIKELKSSIDVLTLTATPIPRTLQMAILGIKNLSLIETPPKNRKSVITYVTPFDKKLVREIVYKEVSRNGQVFIDRKSVV